MSSASKVKIGLCSEEDIPGAFLATSKGFRHDAPFFDAYFPQHDTIAGQAQGVERLSKISKSEGLYLVKASIAADDKQHPDHIIGLAVWAYTIQEPSDKLEDTEDVEKIWPDENDREYMKRLWKAFVVPRREAVQRSKGAGVFVLEVLAVDRQYQRLGAGLALVQWGLDAADQKGVEAVVEGTPIGVRCYHRAGFRTEIEEMNLDVGEGFADRRTPILTFLSRKPKE